MLSAVDIVPGGSNCCLQIFGGSNCCLNFALWYSIAINREIHKARALMDILCTFIWLPDKKPKIVAGQITSIILLVAGPIDA